MEMRGETERARKAAEAAVLMFRNIDKPAPAKPATKSSKKTATARPTRRS
jgi:hypothetical protein